MYHSYFNKHGIYLMPGLTKLDVRDYDLIHLHCYRSIQNIVLSRKATRYGIPYIIDAHGSTVPRTSSKTLLLDAFDWLFGATLMENARLVIAETEIGVKEWEKLDASKDKIRLQHPLLDTGEFNMLPEPGSFRKWYRINDAPIVLFLGRLHWAKGIDTLLYAFHQIIQDNDATLLIAGKDDGYGSALLKLACKLGIQDRVLFTGYINGVHKLAALADAAVLVQPSRYEAGARPSLESIMCGTPVIVTKDTGAGKVIDRCGGGYTVRYGELMEMVSTLQHILYEVNRSADKVAQAKRYIDENLSLENGIVWYERLYQEAVA
jgi:glycosyltransferase involved in cell wall biosynthesis